MINKVFRLLPLIPCLFLSGCGDSHRGHQHGHSHHGHSHTPPHGGTAVILGDEQYHIEFVHDAARGKLQAYLLDSHMDKFIRVTNDGFRVTAGFNARTETLEFKAVASTATGESIGDSASFEADAAWLNATTNFNGTIPRIVVRGRTFENIQFKFPASHESDGVQK